MQMYINIKVIASESEKSIKLFLSHSINNVYVIFIFNLRLLLPDTLVELLHQLFATLPYLLLPLRILLLLHAWLFCFERRRWLLHWLLVLRL